MRILSARRKTQGIVIEADPQSMTPRRALTDSIRGFVLALGMLIPLPLVGAIIWFLHSSYAEDVRAARQITMDATERSTARLSDFIAEARTTLRYYAERPYARKLDPKNCDPLAQDFHLRQTRYANIATLDLDGNLVCSSAPIKEGAPIRVDPTFYLNDVKRTDSPVIGRPARGFITGRWVVSMAEPLRDENGTMVGVIALPIDLVRLQPMASADPSITTSVINADGVIIARSSNFDEFIGKAAHLNPAPILDSDGHGFERRNINGQDTFVAASYVHQTDWIVVTTQPTASALTVMYNRLRTNAVFVAVVLVMTLWLSWIVAGRIIGPIQSLATAVDGIHVNSDLRIVPIGASEVRGVAMKFNLMLDRLSNAETSLRASEARLAGIIDNAFDAIIGIDEGGKIVLFSRAAEAMFGCREESARGQMLTAFIPNLPNMAGNGLSKSSALVAGQGAGRSQMTAIRSDGEAFPVDLTISQGVVNGAKLTTIVLRDETAQRKIEEQLRQAQKMESVGQLTGGVAHDFNNLLTVILGNLQLARDDLEYIGGTKAIDMRIRTAMAAGERGASLTRSLLAFSRQQTLDAKLVDPRQLIRDMISLFQRTLSETIAIELRIEGQWLCLVDPGQLQNAFLNLALNARDAMPNGGRLRLAVKDELVLEPLLASDSQVPPGDYISISVEDTGTGMSAEVLQHAFEPFFTTKELGKGSGLGLSMVYGLIKQSHGHIQIESHVGHGTTVRLFLSRAKALVQETSCLNAEALRGYGEQILVVEDDANVRRLTGKFLASLGYVVELAADGHEALAVLRKKSRVRLMLADLVLPGGISGSELARMAHAIKPSVAIVLMTGYAEGQFDDSKLAADIPIIKKPFDRTQLAAKVAEALKVFSGATEAVFV